MSVNDRAATVANKIMSIICRTGLGEVALRQVTAILRDEFCAIEHEVINEIRLRPEDE
jgi:hypothetical protein